MARTYICDICGESSSSHTFTELYIFGHYHSLYGRGNRQVVHIDCCENCVDKMYESVKKIKQGNV
jgi:hypothetical protein